MNEAAPAITETAAPLPQAADNHGSITTRFGELSIEPAKMITFDRGLYGLEHHHRFLLTSVPGWPDFFKLLQSVDDPSLSLIVLPLEGAEGTIDPIDVAQACDILGFDPSTTVLIGIVTMRDDVDRHVFTVNLKAPLLIDSAQRRGRQHVFESERYQLRHPLPTHDAGGAEDAGE